MGAARREEGSDQGQCASQQQRTARGRKQRQSLELRCGAAESSRIRGSLTTRGPGWQLGSHLSTLAALL